MKSTQQWRAEAEQLWRHGLLRRGQRNEALLNLAIKLAADGIPRAESEELLRKWLLEKNNGMSTTFNRNVALALRDIGPIITSVYERSRRRSAATWGSPRPLSEYEVRHIQAALDMDAARTDPATGEIIDRYEIERFLFELGRRAKEWIAVQAAKATRAREPLPATIWPDQARPEFVVPMPKDMRRKVRGFGRRRDLDLWRALVHGGTLRLVQGPSAKAGRAARYRVNLDFGALSGIESEFDTLAVALTRIMPPQAIDHRYGPKVRGRIERDAAVAALPLSHRDPLPHELFVRQRLGEVTGVARRKMVIA